MDSFFKAGRKNAGVTVGARLSSSGDNGFGKGRKTQVHIVAIVENLTLEFHPSMRLQAVTFRLNPDAQISIDLLSSQQPPKGQRLSQAFGPP
jgi:hypothetical protein